MTSPGRLTANRTNARRSTGPRTKQGKATASRNAVRHGLNSAAPEGSAGYDALVRSLSAAFDTDEEAICTAAEAQDYLIRIRRIKLQIFQSAIQQFSERTTGPQPAATCDVLGAALLSCEAQLRVLDDYERKARSTRNRRFVGSTHRPSPAIGDFGETNPRGVENERRGWTAHERRTSMLEARHDWNLAKT